MLSIANNAVCNYVNMLNGCFQVLLLVSA